MTFAEPVGGAVSLPLPFPRGANRKCQTKSESSQSEDSARCGIIFLTFQCILLHSEFPVCSVSFKLQSLFQDGTRSEVIASYLMAGEGQWVITNLIINIKVWP